VSLKNTEDFRQKKSGARASPKIVITRDHEWWSAPAAH